MGPIFFLIIQVTVFELSMTIKNVPANMQIKVYLQMRRVHPLYLKLKKPNYFEDNFNLELCHYLSRFIKQKHTCFRYISAKL